MAAPRVAQPQPVIARSDISAEAFAKAEEGFVSLFNGKDLTGWRLRNAAKPNGWSVQDGALVNTPPSGNLLTEQQFSDFQLRCELQLPPGGNSGVYLRGRHEVQIGDDFGGRAYPASSGGICGMIAPSENAARPAGEWQTLDITLIGRKVTVVLNGKTVVSDGELTRPTIGALDQDMDRPGPIMLQGIFTAVSFRNIRIRPIGTAAGAPAAEPAEPGFVSLFNGKDLEGWVVMGDPKRWSVSDGVLRCDGPKASDWLRSTREYGDFILKLDCRLSEKGNSGVWLRAPATKNLGALQVQLMTDPYPDPKLANAALTKIAAPEPLTPAAPNVWHSFEVQCIGHRYVVIMDGTKMVDVSSDQAPALESKPLKGYIGLEESWSGPEGYVEFRNIRIKPLGGEVKAPDDAEALQRLGQSFFNSAGGEMVYIPPGEFMMGSTPEERAWASQPENGGARPDRLRREGEQPRPTKIRQGFWMGRTEVTVRQWKQFVDETGYVTNAEKSGSAMASSGKVGQNATVKGASWRQPGFPTADDSPASCMSWDDATAFCDWLNQRKVEAKSLPAGYRFRLPTEAEWEYACRGGRQGTKFWWGDSKEDGKGRLNWAGAEDGFEYVSPVDHYGERGRNGFGLADMLGNVNEWCLDSYDFKGAHEEFYAGNSRDRVARGGAYPQDPAANRCACRSFWAKDGCFINNGFRVCCGVDPANATAPAGAASAQQKP
jgi:formylglycine-generating enzyme required for sulfatase activity